MSNDDSGTEKELLDEFTDATSKSESKDDPKEEPKDDLNAKPTPSTIMDPVENIRLLLEEKLGLVVGTEETVDHGPRRVLETVDFKGLVRHWKRGGFKKIITMVGAGISTSAGIPDFRSKGTGLYNNLKKYNLPYPTAIFEIDYFRKQPQPFFSLAKELFPGKFTKKCEKCKTLVKPDIVFFGENLPDKFYALPSKDFKECDLLIIMGTSLEVQPFASLIHQVNDDCVRLLINREEVGKSSFPFLGDGLHFDSPTNRRDIAWLGDCDDGVKLLVSELDLTEDFDKLMKETQKGLDLLTE